MAGGATGEAGSTLCAAGGTAGTFPRGAGAGLREPADGGCGRGGATGATGAVVVPVGVVPLVVGGALVEVVGGGAAGGHDSLTLTTASFNGVNSDDKAVPAGTDSDNTCPPNSVTLTTH